VVVTRAADQAGELVSALSTLGAAVVEVPVISIAPPEDGGAALRAALAGIGDGDWLAVTSANGVAAVLDALTDGALPPGVRVAAVGPATARALRDAGIEPSLVPAQAVAEALADAFGAPDVDRSRRVVLAQAERARPALAERLASAGWDVTPVVAYRTIDAPVDGDLLARAAAADAITCTSGSTVDAFLAAASGVVDGLPATVVCIGPVTAAVARRHGVAVAAVADPHTTEGLVAAVVSALTGDHPCRS